MAPFLRNLFTVITTNVMKAGEMMKNNNGLKRLLMISAILLFIGGGYVSAMIFGKKVVYEGEGESGLWHASIEKSSKTSIGPNYFLNLYWNGAKEDAKRTIVKTITLYIDGKKYDDRGEYDLSEYTGEEMEGGGYMEDHIATFDFMPEEDVIGHALSVKVEWKTGDEENAEKMKLTKIPWYK
ncbi:YoaO [Bacillus paralicheniformis]|nr:hypothetical protein LI6934_14450 [Bacillus licheniformis LMG 6934]OLG12275.1 YoaO [Bacillus paralicheniformis]TWJ57585.1 hypothetical protein CHCC5023_3815 [Bacillus paralicheniformis]TWJ80488.1 hypothetical protein CHCC5019_0064 [Bacillus paralicheniformis]TWN94333.1 hypothetical protein CHCC20490_1732 [Bacillus paralicheniformis]